MVAVIATIRMTTLQKASGDKPASAEGSNNVRPTAAGTDTVTVSHDPS